MQRETDAKPWLLVLAVVLNAALFLLLGYTIHTGPASTCHVSESGEPT